MIVFELACPATHRFEGWFASSQAFAEQNAAGLVRCPQCDSAEIVKAPMAPAVPAKGNARAAVAQGDRVPPAVAKALAALARAQAKALENSTWVGDAFANHSRAMHYGEREFETIHGCATPDEAIALLDEGVPVTPLPFPVAPPDELS